MDNNRLKELTEQIKANVEKVIVGKGDIIELLLTSMLAGGHVLLEDVPGTGKTVLAKSLAKSLDAEFKRIQFTPDLLPSDVTGLNFYNQKEGEFNLRKGPIFTNILLADEINRATPRTQSSLLECMEEKQVTIDGETRTLTMPFLVIATQNPVETAGTFPLPEAQLDRFLMQITMGFPSFSEEIMILNRFMGENPFNNLKPVLKKEELLAMQEHIKSIYVHPSLMEYMVTIINKTRNHKNLALGVSPRGSLAFLRAIQAYSALKGMEYATPEVISYLAPFVLNHRLVLRNTFNKVSAPSEVIANILSDTPVPTEDFRRR